MPKLTNSTIFSRRKAVVLLLDDNENSMLGQPILDEFQSRGPKTQLEIAKIRAADFKRSPGLDGVRMAVVGAVSKAVSPTLVMAPDVFDGEEDGMLNSYIKLLVASAGGFIVRCGHFDGKKELFNPKASIPVINFDKSKNSWLDVETKIRSLVRTMSSAAVNERFSTAKLLDQKIEEGAVCLGDISRAFVSTPSPDNKITAVVNVNGPCDFPITVCEFATKVWNNPDLAGEKLDPDHTVVLRNGHILSILAISKIVGENNKDVNVYTI